MPIITSFDGTKVYYECTKGPKVPLFFIHGWPHNSSAWKEEAEVLAKQGHSIINIDLRGYGKSDKPLSADSYSLEAFVKDIKLVLDAQNIDHAIFIGHSFGGMVLLKFYEQFRSNCTSLILVDSGYENPIKHISYLKHLGEFAPLTIHLLNFIVQHDHLQKKHFPDVDFSKMNTHKDFYYWIQGAKQTSLQALIACLKDMLELDEKEVLKQITVPTLIIEGENDDKTPLEEAQKMNALIPNSELVVLSKEPHDTNLTSAKQVASLISSFVDGLQ